MESTTSIISLVLFIGLVLSPILIIKRQFNHKGKNEFISYLTLGIVITTLLTLAFAWWSATSDKMLLVHYGYNIDGMTETEFYEQVAPENMERVKSLEASIMGIGWPLKAIMMYVFCIPYMLIVYFANKSIQKHKR